jgi:hypothetical protein
MSLADVLYRLNCKNPRKADLTVQSGYEVRTRRLY